MVVVIAAVAGYATLIEFVFAPPAISLAIGSRLPAVWTSMGRVMLAGRTDARWVVASRRWTLAAWGFLGIGMLLGAHWAYEEVGWGGFWAWDPVENAALMPWLVATAFLHSVMVQERTGMLKVWNIALIAGAFALSIFGTFLTRSGILSSIHAFVASDIGWYFMVGLGAILLGSLALILWRLPILRADQRIESVVSREATFLFNNLLLVGLAFAVLWGVVFPLVTEALGRVRESVSTPFYDFFVIAFGLPMLLLMGAGPLIAWRRASWNSLRITFLWPFVGGVATGVVMLLVGLGSSWPGVAAGSICAFVTVTILSEFVRGTMARRRIAGEGTLTAFAHLVDRNRRRYGGYIVHLGVIVFVIGAIGASAYQTERQAVLAQGQSMQVGAFTLTSEGVERTRGPNFSERAAVLRVTSDGTEIGVLRPAQRAYIQDLQARIAPHGITTGMWFFLRALFQEVRKELRTTGCTRAILTGHNSFFDLQFLNAAVERTGIKRNPFHPFSSFDTVTLAGVALGQTVLSRAAIAAGFDWSDEEAHSALYDAAITAKLFCTIVNRFRGVYGR